jgi:hypothetical protein
MKSYTIQQIKDHWEKYEAAQVMSYLKSGKWNDKEVSPNRNAVMPVVEGATSIKYQKLKNVMSFPEYLEKHG